MTTAEDVLKVAVAEIGYRENYSNRTKFGQWYGVDGVPWCAIFVSFCFNRAGLTLPATKDIGFAYCPYGVNWFKEQNQFGNNPCIGDVVFYDWNKDGIADHIGIVEKINADGSIVAIEGNTSTRDNSNGGKVMRRRRLRSQCLGFGKPSYNDTSSLILSQMPTVPIRLTNPFRRGIDVFGFQQQLSSLGYDIMIDGIYGTKSKAVCLKFQKDNELEVDGIVGKATWTKAFSTKKQTSAVRKNLPESNSSDLMAKKAISESSKVEKFNFQFDEDDIDILARTIYGEARGESRSGRIGVAFSVLNRLKANSWYGKSIKGICKKPWQYSVWNKSDPNLKVITTVTTKDKLFRESIEIARSVLAEEIEDITNGSTHYYAKYIDTPKWARGKQPVVAIDNHLFFNNID